MPLTQVKGVDTKDFKLGVATDSALCYLNYLLLDCLCFAQSITKRMAMV